MNTFICETDYMMAAGRLDLARLRPRYEGKFLVQALLFPTKDNVRTQHHPATLMWKGYEWSLLNYLWEIHLAWVGLGYEDNNIREILRLYWNYLHSIFPHLTEKGFNNLTNEEINVHLLYLKTDRTKPSWVWEPESLNAYRKNLIHKNPSHYQQFWPNVVGEKVPYYYWKLKERM